MLKEWQESYSTKYGSPFAAYVFETLEDVRDLDESDGDATVSVWVGRIGRRVLVNQSSGFCDVYRYATEEEAHAAFIETRPVPLDVLTEDGDEIELSDGRTLRLRIEPDETSSIDGNGKLAPVNERPSEYGRQRSRPTGFDGNAEILRVGRGYDGYWWQPPADVKRGTESFRTIRANLIELLESGYYSVGLELLQGVDAYRRPIVVNAAWLGGVEPAGLRNTSYLAEVIDELAAELNII